MKNSEIFKIIRQHTNKTGDTRGCSFGCTILPPDVNQHCFYCNYSLECGQQECIWREDSA